MSHKRKIAQREKEDTSNSRHQSGSKTPIFQCGPNVSSTTSSVTANSLKTSSKHTKESQQPAMSPPQEVSELDLYKRIYGTVKKEGKNKGKIWTKIVRKDNGEEVKDTFRWTTYQLNQIATYFEGKVNTMGPNYGREYSCYKMKGGEIIAGSWEWLTDPDPEYNPVVEENEEIYG